MEKLQELIQILEISAQITNFSSKVPLESIAQIILQRLIHEGIDNFHKSDAQKVVIEVLQHHHCQELAESYLEYCRQRLQTSTSLAKASPNNEGLPVVAGYNQAHAWEKNKIASALEKECGISRDIAKQIEDAVENKISHAQIRHITTAQIRELVDNELFSRGYRKYWQRQSLLGIPKFNLKSFLYPEYHNGVTRDIQQLITNIASVIFRQYSIEEVFSREVVEAHIAGSIHIEGISLPMKIFSLLLYPQSRCLFGDMETPEELVIALMANVERILPYVQSFIYIYHPDTYLKATELRHIRSLLTAFTHNFQRYIPSFFILDNLLGKFIEYIYTMYREADNVNKRGLLPSLVVPICAESFGPEQQENTYLACKLALEMRKVTFSFFPCFPGNWPDPDKASWALDCIFLNLVQPAYRAGKNNIEQFWQELNVSFTLAVKAHLDKRRFFLSLAEGPLEPLFQAQWKDTYALNKGGCFLEIVGLPESVLCLTGVEMSKEQGLEIGIQILAHLQELIENVEQKHRIPVHLLDCIGNNKAEQRFVELDMERYPGLKNILPEASYTKGPHFRLVNSLSTKEKIQIEGKLHRYFPSVVPLMPEIDHRELFNLLCFAKQDTEAMAVRIC